MPDTHDQQFYCVCPIDNGSDVGLPPSLPRHPSVLIAVRQDKARVAAQGHRRRRTDAPVQGLPKQRR
jgi:hypothetical protein